MNLLKTALLAASVLIVHAEAHATLSHILPLLQMARGGNPFMPGGGGGGGNPFMPSIPPGTGEIVKQLPGLIGKALEHMPGGGQQPGPVPGQTVEKVPGGGQQPGPVPGQTVEKVPGGGQQPGPVPGQTVEKVPGGGQQPGPVPGQTVEKVPGGGQQPGPVPGQTVEKVPGGGQQPGPVPGQTVEKVPGGGQQPGPVPGQTVEKVPGGGQQPGPVPGQTVEKVPGGGQQPGPVPGQTMEKIPGGGEMPDLTPEEKKKTLKDLEDISRELEEAKQKALNEASSDNAAGDLVTAVSDLEQKKLDILKRATKNGPDAEMAVDLAKAFADFEKKKLDIMNDIVQDFKKIPGGAFEDLGDLQKTMKEKASNEWKEILEKKKEEWKHKFKGKEEEFEAAWKESVKQHAEDATPSQPETPESKHAGCACPPRHRAAAPKHAAAPARLDQKGDGAGMEYGWEAERKTDWVMMPDGTKVITKQTGWQPSNFWSKEKNDVKEEKHWAADPVKTFDGVVNDKNKASTEDGLQRSGGMADKGKVEHKEKDRLHGHDVTDGLGIFKKHVDDNLSPPIPDDALKNVGKKLNDLVKTNGLERQKDDRLHGHDVTDGLGKVIKHVDDNLNPNPAGKIADSATEPKKDEGIPSSPSDQSAALPVNYIVVPEKSEVSVTADMMGSKTSGKSPVKEGKVSYSAKAPEKTSVDMLTSLELDGALGTASKTVGLFKNDPTSHFISKKVTPSADGKTFTVEGDLTMAGDTQPITGEGQVLQDDGKVLVITTKLKIDPNKFAKALGAAKAMMSGLEIDAKLYATKDPNAAGSGEGAAPAPSGQPSKTTEGQTNGEPAPAPTPGATPPAASAETPAGAVRYKIIPEKSRSTGYTTLIGGMKQDTTSKVTGGFIEYDKSKLEEMHFEATKEAVPSAVMEQAGVNAKDLTGKMVLTKVIPDGQGGFDYEGDVFMDGETKKAKGKAKILVDDGNVLEISVVSDGDSSMVPKALGKFKSMVQNIHNETVFHAERDPSAAPAGDKAGAPDAKSPNPAEVQKKEADAKDPTKENLEAVAKQDGGNSASPSDQSATLPVNYIVVPEKSEVSVTADMMGSKTSGKSPVKEGKVSYSAKAPEKTSVDMLTSLELDGALGTASKTVGLFKNDPTSHFISKKVTPSADGKTFTVEGDLTMAGDTQPITGEGQVLQDDGKVLVITTKLKIDPNKFAKALGAAKAMMSGLEIDAKLYATKDPNAAGSGEGAAPAPSGQPSKTTEGQTNGEPAPAPTPGATPPAASAETPAGAVRYKIIPEKSRSTGYTTLIGGMKQDTTSKVTGGFIEYDKSKLEEMHFEATKEAVPSAVMEQAGVNAKDLTGKMVLTKVIPDGQGGFDYEGDVFMDGETKKAKGKAKILVDDGNVLEISVVSDGDSSMVPKALGKFKSMVQNIHNETVFHAERDPSAAPAGDKAGAPDAKSPNPAEVQKKEADAKDPTKENLEAVAKQDGGNSASPSDQSATLPVNYIVVPEKSEVSVTADMMGSKTSGKSPVKEGKVSYSAKAPEKTSVDMLTSLELDGALGTASKTVGLFKNDPTSHFISKKVTPSADGKTFTVEGDLTMAGDTQPITGEGQVLQDDGKVLVITTKLKIDPNKFAKALGAAKAMMSGLEIDAKLYATKGSSPEESPLPPADK